jgi:peptidoglycan/LPS O-acetylase OafA/YrhL
MTATLTPSATPSTAATAGTRSLWRTGLRAGACAAAATVAIAATAGAAGVSLDTAPGEAIPLYAFAQLTLVFTVVGILIARAIGRRSSNPRTTLLRVTVALTALSLVPDAILSAGVATKATLMLTHLVAAAIVIPALRSCMLNHRSEATMIR